MVLRLTRMRPGSEETGETEAGSKGDEPRREAPDDAETGSGEKDGPMIGFGLFADDENEDQDRD